MPEDKGYRLVWRIEDQKGVGAYASGLFLNILPGHQPKQKLGDPDPWPLIMEEIGHDAWRDGPWHNWKGRFGFATKEQMFAWFGKSGVDDMLRQGGRLARYRVPGDKVFVTPTQCLFDLDHAERVSP